MPLPREDMINAALEGIRARFERMSDADLSHLLNPSPDAPKAEPGVK